MDYPTRSFQTVSFLGTAYVLTRDGFPVYCSHSLDFIIAKLSILLLRKYDPEVVRTTSSIRVNPESFLPIHKVHHPDLDEEWLIQEIECD